MPASASPAIKWKRIASLLLNLAVAVMAAIGTSLSVRVHGSSLFQFYTEDSNLFAMVACALFAACTLRSMVNGAPVPQWVRTLKFAAVCCLMVTFVVVVTILSPQEGKDGYRVMLLSGSMLYHHLLCPLAALISFLFLEGFPPLPRRAAFTALLPTLVYAAVIVVLNLFKIVDGPYPFLHVYSQPVWMSVFWFAVILGGAYLFARLILWAGGKCSAAKA